MQWSDFYDGFWDWTDSTRKTRISSLENIGPGEEVVEVILEIQDEKVRSQLVRKAIKLKVSFTGENFADLDGCLPEEVYAQLGEYTGFDPEDPYFAEDNMTWDDFYDRFYDWDEATVTRRIEKLTQFGPSEEVLAAIANMPSPELERILYHKAVAAGVHFTREQQMELSWAEDEEPQEADDEQIPEQTASRGFWWHVFHHSWGRADRAVRDNRRCNGDCDNCPAHYGYRYGRWYYGHGHQHGCERGGNGGATGRTNRD